MELYLILWIRRIRKYTIFIKGKYGVSRKGTTLYAKKRKEFVCVWEGIIYLVVRVNWRKCKVSLRIKFSG